MGEEDAKSCFKLLTLRKLSRICQGVTQTLWGNGLLKESGNKRARNTFPAQFGFRVHCEAPGSFQGQSP